MLGGLGIVPVFHSIGRYGMDMANSTIGANYVFATGAVYIFGAGIYAFRIPERWFPLTFDIFGHSHQIWHLFVIAGGLVHYAGVVTVLHWWHTNNPQCAYNDLEMLEWFK